MKKTKITITGANGFVGRNVGSFLSRNGFEVIGLVRRKRAIHFGRSVTSENLLENDVIGYAKGSHALLHFIGRGRQNVDFDYETVNVGLTRNAIKLCKKAGIKKIVYLSGLGVDKKSTLGYFISKFKAEQLVIDSGLDYTIFRPSYILGRNDPLTSLLQRQLRVDRVSIPGSGRYRLQPIYVEDVAKVILLSVTEKRFSKKVLDLVGPQTVRYDKFLKDLVGQREIRIEKIDFERAFCDALHSKSEFSVDDLGVLVGDYVGDHKRLERVAKIKLTKYNTMLESCGLS